MNTRSFFLLFALTIFTAFAVESCKHTPSGPLTTADTTGNGDGDGNNKIDTIPRTPRKSCSTDTVYFANTILPLITSNCSMSGCHDGISYEEEDHGKGELLFALTSYSSIVKRVSAGKPGSSKLYNAIAGKGEDKMPPKKPLLSSQDSLIYLWIKQGALNNFCEAACDTTNLTFAGTIEPLIRDACIGCHSGSSPSGGILLTNFQQIQTQATNGKLLGSVTYSYGFKGMPSSGKLSDCDVNAIRIWIRNGAPNN